MSRNGQFHFEGLREDDANLRLSGAVPSASGSAESDRLAGQPAEMFSNGRMGGLREDDASVVLSGLREDDASVSMGGLREDDAFVKMGGAYAQRAEGASESNLDGLREDDASVRMDGAYAPRAEGDAESLRGLREDDASVRMDGAYAPDAGSSAEGDLRGLREDDASLRLGDVESMSAEANRYDRLADAYLGKGAGRGIKGVAARAGEEAVRAARVGQLRSKGEVETMIRSRLGKRLEDLRAQVAAMPKIINDAVAFEMKRIDKRLTEIFKKGTSVAGMRLGYILRGLREDDADLRLMGLREDDSNLKMEGLREDDASVSLTGAEEVPPRLGADGFHERFPVVVEIKGLGQIRCVAYQSQMSGFLDFLKPLPSSTEYLGTLRVLVDRWENATKPRLNKLNTQSKNAIIAQMTALNNDPSRYDGMKAFLTEGAGAMTLSRWERVERLNAYIPTIDTLIAQAESFGPQATPAAETQVVNQTAAKDLANRQDAVVSGSFIEKAAPYAIGGAIIGTIVTVVAIVANR